jgi:hypothetical protein
MANSRSKQFISFKLLAILSSMMKSYAVWPLPARDVSHPYHTVPMCREKQNTERVWCYPWLSVTTEGLGRNLPWVRKAAVFTIGIILT